MGHLGHRRVHRVGQDHIAVVLAGDEHPALLQVPDGVVAPPVAVIQPAGFGPGGQGQKLMPQTDAEQGDIALIQLFQLGNDSGILRRVTGAVGEHHPIKAAGQHRLRRSMRREGGDAAAPAAQALDHVLLNAVVHHSHAVLLLAVGGKHLRLLPGHPVHRALHPVGAQALQHLGHIKMLRTGDHAVHAPLTAEYLCQRPGVHPLDTRDIMLLQKVVQRALTAEIAAAGRQMPHHKGLHPGAGGFVVLMVDAIVSDQGIGHHYPLPRVRGVCQDLLITGHRGIEHHLTDPVGGAADACPGKYASVGQDQSRFHQFSHAFRSSSPVVRCPAQTVSRYCIENPRTLQDAVSPFLPKFFSVIPPAPVQAG